MAEQPTQEEVIRWHRWFAVECNNAAWALAARAMRTADEDRDLEQLAMAAAHHWSRSGTALNVARADVLLAHVYSLLGDGPRALGAARRSLQFFEQGRGEDWDVAFAHIEMAHAAAAVGDAALHAQHYAVAQRLAQQVADQEDRRIVAEELAKIPAPPARPE